MKRDNINLYILILLLTAVIFSFLTIYAFGEQKQPSFSISGRSAVLYQPENEEFLYIKNADVRMPMASTTKIMTALVALENSDMSEVVKVDDSAIGTEGSSAYLRQGDVLTMEELLYALLLQSANDAAVAIACHISGNVEGFAELMNEKALELKLSNTHFENPHGLDGKEHYTTARELALIAAEAMKNENFKAIVSTSKKSFITEERSRTYVNHNKLLYLYDDCVGVKTGFTKKSGRCLVGAAERDELCFISVTLDAPNDWNDHTTMLNYGFDTLEKIGLCQINDFQYVIPVLDGERDSIRVGNLDSADYITDRGEHRVEEHIRLIRYSVAPIMQGDILGEVIYTVDGNECARVALVAEETVNKKEKQGFIHKILSIFD